MDLLNSWAEWEPTTPPFILETDRDILTAPKHAKTIVTYGSWDESIKTPDFGAPGDRRFHLGLIPQPFFGDLRNASIYILLLNPGLGPHDYFGEYQVPEYRRVLLRNLKQKFKKDTVPFLFLNPQFSWHGGFGYWHNKLRLVIKQLSEIWDIPFADARTIIGKKLASLEMIPYHSDNFGNITSFMQKLNSVKLSLSFAKDVILTRVKAGKAIAIITRRIDDWNLPDHKRIIKYSPQQARAAHLTPNSPGGSEIIKFLTLN